MPPTDPTSTPPAWHLDLAAAPDEALRQAIARPLIDFNTATAGPSGHQTLVLTVRDADGAVCGGLWGATAYGWLYTQMLAVPAAARGQGLGRTLMLAAEAEARRRGCHHAWVDTQFGARGFYERLGYTAFGALPDYPPGFTRTFLSKSLPP
jgi:GNAT superfamily N-acetyltransferase